MLAASRNWTIVVQVKCVLLLIISILGIKVPLLQNIWTNTSLRSWCDATNMLTDRGSTHTEFFNRVRVDTLLISSLTVPPRPPPPTHTLLVHLTWGTFEGALTGRKPLPLPTHWAPSGPAGQRERERETGRTHPQWTAHRGSVPATELQRLMATTLYGRHGRLATVGVVGIMLAGGGGEQCGMWVRDTDT